jgi:hypothetical protein
MSGARGRIGPGSDDVDPRRPAETGERSVDPTTASLAREVYWASDGASRPSAAVGSLRGRLDAFIQQMRADERQLMPFGETLLGSAAGWKRFSTKRYDRLLADLAEMNRELAQRLHETEEEVARLREEHGNEGGEPS